MPTDEERIRTPHEGVPGPRCPRPAAVTFLPMPGEHPTAKRTVAVAGYAA